MFRVSNFVVGLANTLVMLVGASAIGYSIYMFVHQDVTDCQSAIRAPLLTTGCILFVVSLIGVIGSCFKENFAMVLYLFILFSGIVALMVFSIFLFFVTNKGAGRVVSGRGYKEYRTVDFSTWLNGFVGGKRWVGIRSCLAEASVCDDLSDGRVSQIADAFYHKNLSPIQVLLYVYFESVFLITKNKIRFSLLFCFVLSFYQIHKIYIYKHIIITYVIMSKTLYSLLVSVYNCI